MRLPQHVIDSIFARAKALAARLAEMSAVRLNTWTTEDERKHPRDHGRFTHKGKPPTADETRQAIDAIISEANQTFDDMGRQGRWQERQAVVREIRRRTLEHFDAYPGEPIPVPETGLPPGSEIKPFGRDWLVKQVGDDGEPVGASVLSSRAVRSYFDGGLIPGHDDQGEIDALRERRERQGRVVAERLADADKDTLKRTILLPDGDGEISPVEVVPLGEDVKTAHREIRKGLDAGAVRLTSEDGLKLLWHMLPASKETRDGEIATRPVAPGWTLEFSQADGFVLKQQRQRRLSTVRRDHVLARLHDAAEGGNEFARLSLIRLSKPISLSLNRGKKGQEKEAVLGRNRHQNAHGKGGVKECKKVSDPADDLDDLDELTLPDFDPTRPGPLADVEDWRAYNEALEEHERDVAAYEHRLRELHERLAVRR